MQPAGVFDERAGGDVGTGGGGLALFDKLAVTVVDEADAAGFEVFHQCAGAADGGDAEGRTQAVAAGALDEYELGFCRERCRHPLPIDFPVGSERNFAVGNAEVGERAGDRPRVADDRLHGVVWGAGYGQQFVARPQQAEKDGGQSVGAGDEVAADKSFFRTEDVGPNRVERVAPGVAVSVTGGGAEVVVAYLMAAEGVEDPGGVAAGDGVDAGEQGGRFFEGGGG